MYLNGKLVASGSGSQIWRHRGNTGIGAIFGHSALASGPVAIREDKYFKGAIDEVQIFNSVLTAEQIQSYYTKMKQ